MKRLARLAGTLVAGLLGVLLVAEAGFRVAGLFVGRAADAPAAGDDHVVVLCIGDSHTYGMGKGYPATLAARLAERSPRYRVINLGVPGSNTAQVRRRFLDNLDTYRPRLVIHWAGLNNAWNRADGEAWTASGVAPAPLWRRLLEASRVWRFIRVWQHQAELQRILDASGALVAPALTKREGDQREQFRQRVVGDEDVFRHQRAGELPAEEMTRVTALDLRWMIERARERGIPMVAITYPFWNGWFGAANDGIREAAQATGVPVVEAVEGIGRLRARWADHPQDQPVGFDATVHPTQALYDEIAGLVLETLDRTGVLPPAS